METFLRSIGVGGEALEHLDKASLAFQRPVLLWGGLLLLLPVAWYIIRRQRQNLSTAPKKYLIALNATRITVLAIMVFVLSGPYLKIDHQLAHKPIVAVLFDSSQSMKLPAGPFSSEEELLRAAKATGRLEEKEEQDDQAKAGEPPAIDDDTRQAISKMNRAQLAEAVVRAADESFSDALSEDYELRYYTFARQPSAWAFDAADEQQPPTIEGGSSSHIGEAVYHVLDEAAGRQVAGIVLMSDGQNTGGRSPSQAARAAADAGAPIFTAALGSEERMKDVSIVDVYTSGQAAVGDTVAVHVALESQGFDGSSVKVELKDGNQTIDTQDAVLRDSEHQHVELTFKASVPGARYLSVNVPALDDEVEALKANNSDTAFVRISEEKLKVLLVDGLPRWDFRFIKNAIRRDNGLAGEAEDQPDVLVETEWRRLPQDQQAAALPQSAEEFSEYHTIILGDVSPKLLTDEMRQHIAEAVRVHGVGLIVAAGPQSMPHKYDTTFQDLLPVKLSSNEPGVQAPVYNPFRLEVSPAGEIHETMRLYDDTSRNQEVWGRMPPYYWCAAAERPSAAATVLAYNPSLSGRFGKAPLIAWHYAGDGKVLFVGTDSTWLWRQNVGDRYFYKFWGQAIRMVARHDDTAGNKSRLEVRPRRAQPGERAEIELMAYDAEGAPMTANRATVSILAPGERQTIELTADKTKEGRYVGGFVPNKAGVHRLVYQPYDGSGAVESVIRVLIAPEEYRHPNVNRSGLSLLASATGGRLLELDELSTVPELITGETELKQLHYEATIWDNWLVLSLLVLVYSLDVGLRRMMGLS